MEVIYCSHIKDIPDVKVDIHCCTECASKFKELLSTGLQQTNCEICPACNGKGFLVARGCTYKNLDCQTCGGTGKLS